VFEEMLAAQANRLASVVDPSRENLCAIDEADVPKSAG